MAKKFKPQFRRLMVIDHALRRQEKVNCATLLAHPEYEAIKSRKTPLRDIEYLRYDIGAPIEYDDSRKSYYYTDPNYSFAGINLDAGELFSIMIAQKVLEQYRNTPLHGILEGAFEKIRDMLPDKVAIAPSQLGARYSFFFPPATLFRPKVWDAVTLGLAEDRILCIEYTVPGRKDAMPRQVDPYHLVNHGGAWYLVGFCHVREGIRTFALSRIEKAVVLDEVFLLPDGFDLHGYMGDHFGIMWGDREYNVKLCFEPWCRQYVVEREWHPTQKITQRQDGSVILAFKANQLIEVERWVLSWGRGVRVLGPKKLREMVLHDAKGMVEMNSDCAADPGRLQ
jgi:proteasome accessory factor B